MRETKGIKADAVNWELGERYQGILHIIPANTSANVKLCLQNFFLKTWKYLDWKNRSEVLGQRPGNPRGTQV